MRFALLLPTIIAMSIVAHAQEPRGILLAQAGGPLPMWPVVPAAPKVPDALQKQLDAVLATKNYTELAKALNQAPLTERMTWVTSRLMAGKTAFLGYQLLRDLWGLAQLKDPRLEGMADTAVGVMALYVYQVILVDGAICEDVSARGPQQIRYLTTFRPILQGIKTLSVEEKKNVISAAIGLEQKTRSFRKGDDFLCRGGMQEFQASVEQLGSSVTVGELAAKYGEKSKTGIGTDVMLPPAKAYEPKFLPSEKYSSEQHELRMKMVPTLIELLK